MVAASIAGAAGLLREPTASDSGQSRPLSPRAATDQLRVQQELEANPNAHPSPNPKGLGANPNPHPSPNPNCNPTLTVALNPSPDPSPNQELEARSQQLNSLFEQQLKAQYESMKREASKLGRLGLRLG